MLTDIERLKSNCANIRSSALTTEQLLQDSWKRPVRHNEKLQRSALWHAVYLGTRACEVLAADRTPLRQSGTAADHYDFEAGLHTVQALLPFDTLEHRVLQDIWPLDPYFSGEQTEGGCLIDDMPELETRWHRWLWTPGERRDAPSLEGQMLAEGCHRLSLAVRGIRMAPSLTDQAADV